MEKHALVYVDLAGTPHLVGRLWARMGRGRESATFEYDRVWLARADRFALEPALKLGHGPFHTASDKPLYGAIGDSAPDRWGRVLMRRAERRRAERARETPRTLWEIDYLLMVDDEARQGALRFAARDGGPFLAADATAIPPLIELPRLLSAADHVEDHSDNDEDLRLLLAPGSSLGGARPKASVRDKDGHLVVAKFPHKGDEINAVRWEAVALSLAAKAGIPVPTWRVECVGAKSVLLLRRFDRAGIVRIPFVSAMRMKIGEMQDARIHRRDFPIRDGDFSCRLCAPSGNGATDFAGDLGPLVASRRPRLTGWHLRSSTRICKRHDQRTELVLCMSAVVLVADFRPIQILSVRFTDPLVSATNTSLSRSLMIYF